ncbi:Ethylene-and jasmonate-responsive plant defensin [Mycena sanguinolenta]|uniref:Ethylene-and jasmonate-responsive plant defensin n=1 Tax=Mycena sanguinolenta TaxID=230812 RepID=A0A8H6Y5T5_9AGAR|nr:Ethylene-and jasmonate-responsive plant defensin [Mycena sanguinolenta]
MAKHPPHLPRIMADETEDSVRHFLMECHKISIEAQFIVDSLPNAETPAVERVTHQLDAIQEILVGLNDPYLHGEDLDSLILYVTSLLSRLEDFLACPPLPAHAHIPRQHRSGRGRPAYVLDLQRAILLHDLGNPWDDVAKAMGVSRATIYNHLQAAGLSSARQEWSTLSDTELDKLVSEISQAHPFVGSTIIMGHLEGLGIHLPRARVQESLRRVDRLGVLVRWSGIIKRRVYRVRGANALWHNDGNEKLRPWGFWVHGCIDGHSRLIIYLECRSNKRASTVGGLFKRAVAEFGWPSRGRGDFGRENNEMERLLIEHWGENHRAYLRGRSLHNIRIERLWRDVRKDSLETFRQIFMYLTANDLLVMEEPIHAACLFLVFQPRIQGSLDRTRDAWNHHKIRTAGHRTPIALYELSRETAIARGYWTGDMGGDLQTASDPLYGYDGEAPNPPAGSELDSEALSPVPTGIQAEREAGICLNDDEELARVQEVMHDFDFAEDDGNWGIDVYCKAVLLLSSRLSASS